MTGKTAVVLVNDPGFGTSDSTFFKGNTMTYYGRWTYKYEEAARQGAEGVIIVHNTAPAGYAWNVVQSSWTGEALYLKSEDGNQSRCAFEGWVSQQAARQLMEQANIENYLGQARKPGFQPIPMGLTASLTMDVTYREATSQNVIAKRTGSERPDEYIIYSAHWDHIGVGKPVAGDSIYNGALDNASGTAVMLEIAEAFSQLPEAPERTVIFLAVTAEEQGLLGSAYYAENPTYPVNQTVANINMDGIHFRGPMKELNNVAPQVNLNQILNYVAPSFTSNTQTISDGTDHIDPASLRGLGPDQVLVLVNGKRRHTSSLVNVNGTFGRGSVGTDLNAIPAAAIQRLEVLRDGAAAQYGSDAIAGVINIVLNKSVNELNTTVTTGANFSKNANDQTGGVDGESTNVAASYGISMGDNGGFLNLSGDFDVRQDYSRMLEWEGNVFNQYNVVERFARNDGYDVSNLLDDDVADVIQYAGDAGIALNGATTKEELQPILSEDATEAELAARGQERSDYNMRVGQSALRGGRFFANLSLPLDDNGTELYSFAGLSSRTGNSAGFYRLPNQSRTYTPAYPNGFLPEINSNIKDQSLALGIKGKVGDWDVDLSNTYGRNAFLYTIGNTFNASLQRASPTIFDAGGFSFAKTRPI